MNRRPIRTAATIAMVGAVLGGATAAQAAPPTVERITVDETSPDDFLSEACGVEVTTTVRGSITIRTFDRDQGPVELTNINLGITATANGSTFRLRDVGSDLVRITPDGTAVLRISGQVPGAFAGTLKINLDTGETILEPKDRSEKQLARACAALTK